MVEYEYKYDVFISYNHADEDWVVNTLLPTLEKAGLKVCIDYKDLGAGGIVPGEIENDVKASCNMILVMRDGDIVEQDNREELLEKGGFYVELYNSQFDKTGVRKWRAEKRE